LFCEIFYCLDPLPKFWVAAKHRKNHPLYQNKYQIDFLKKCWSWINIGSVKAAHKIYYIITSIRGMLPLRLALKTTLKEIFRYLLYTLMSPKTNNKSCSYIASNSPYNWKLLIKPDIAWWSNGEWNELMYPITSPHQILALQNFLSSQPSIS